MKPPPMCAECEGEFVRTVLAEGCAAAMAAQGDKACPHVVDACGIKIVPGPDDWPRHIIAEWHPHPIVVWAYAGRA